jgi:hypothetical protein
MVRRQIARTTGVAASGLLGAALVPVAVAFADVTDTSSLTLDGPETVTGLYNMTTAPPGINQSLQGFGAFNVLNSSGGTNGVVYGYESSSPYLLPNLGNASELFPSSQVLYVDSDVQTLLGSDPTAAYLPDGSVVGILGLGGLGEDVYTSIPGADGNDTVTYVLQTPYGSIDLSDLVNSMGFDASRLEPVLPSAPGDSITGIGDPTIVAVSGLPPATMVLQGVQDFQYNGNADATFRAVETTTQDLLGTRTEALLVTQSLGPDSLPVGSIYNTIDFDGMQNIYSSIPQADGTDQVSDILYNTTTGQTMDLTSLFAGTDASAGLADGSAVQDISFGDYLIQANPDSPEVFTGINGLPPLNASIQGTQLFDLYQNGSDAPTATFTADVTTMPDTLYFHYSEALLVTDTSDPTLLPTGSVVDLATYGSGYENIYADLPGLGADGHNLITDTLVTPFGDMDLSWLYASIDAAAGLNAADGVATLASAPWLDLFS